MRDRGGGRFVDQAAAFEAVQAERGGHRVGLAGGQGRGEAVAGTGRRLETAGAPAAIEEQIVDRGLADDRAAVAGDVDDAAPLAHHAQAAE